MHASGWLYARLSRIISNRKPTHSEYIRGTEDGQLHQHAFGEYGL